MFFYIFLFRTLYRYVVPKIKLIWKSLCFFSFKVVIIWRKVRPNMLSKSCRLSKLFVCSCRIKNLFWCHKYGLHSDPQYFLFYQQNHELINSVSSFIRNSNYFGTYDSIWYYVGGLRRKLMLFWWLSIYPFLYGTSFRYNSFLYPVKNRDIK